MLLSVILIFTGAIIAPLLSAVARRKEGVLLAVIPAGLFAYYLTFIDSLGVQNGVQENYIWAVNMGVQLSFFMDGLSLLFSLLILGVGALILIYSSVYMHHHHHKGRFYAFLMLFMGAMLGLVLASNLIALFIFWELTSLASFLLIGFYNHKKAARKAAVQALLVTEIGGLALLSAFVLMGIASGGFELVDMLNKPNVFHDHPYYHAIIILVFLGVFTKSAQFPFHFWLPGAMLAPAPVSAYLHSATMVKAGVYLLARLTPFLGNTPVWNNSLILVGGITMFFGAYFAITQKDIKKLLAFTTVNSLGILVMLIGTGTKMAVKAMLIYMVVHVFYKASLFMVAGIIEEKTGTRNMNHLGNLKQKLPLITVFSILVLLSMAGLPPMLGYVSKELIYEAKIHASDLSLVMLVLNVLSNIFMIAVSMLFAYNIFLRKNQSPEKLVSRTSFPFWIGPGVLGVLGFLLALFPNQFEPILEFSFEAVMKQTIKVDITLWHGISEVFWISIGTVAAGVGLFVFRKKTLGHFEQLNQRIFYIDLSKVIRRFMKIFLGIARQNAMFIQHGYYRFYVLTILVVSILLLWWQIIVKWNFDFWDNLTPFYYLTLGIILPMVAGIIAILFSRSKLKTIVIMGLVGYGLALIYLIYGAVDLSITQFFVETLTLILFVMVVYRLPSFEIFSSRVTRFRDAMIALLVGGFMFALTLKSYENRPEAKVSDYFIQNSYEKAHGKNIVNTILVDFRALDTLGEVTVLVIAAFGVVALLRMKKSNAK